MNWATTTVHDGNSDYGILKEEAHINESSNTMDNKTGKIRYSNIVLPIIQRFPFVLIFYILEMER